MLLLKNSIWGYSKVLKTLSQGRLPVFAAMSGATKAPETQRCLPDIIADIQKVNDVIRIVRQKMKDVGGYDYDAFLRSVLGQVVTLREQTTQLGQCAVKKQGWLKELAEKEVYLSELRNLAQSLAAGKKTEDRAPGRAHHGQAHEGPARHRPSGARSEENTLMIRH